MGNVRVIEKTSDVKQTLQEFLDRAEHFDGVICIGLNKDGSQFIQTSTMSAMEKIFLIQFAANWVFTWFRRDE